MAAVFLVQWKPASASGSLSPILWLDASNTSSYPGSGSVWTDLSTFNRHGTLVGGVTYNASLQAMQFSGGPNAASYISLAGNMRSFTGGITIEFEADFGAVADNWERIFDFAEAPGLTANDFFVGRFGDKKELTVEIFKAGDTSNNLKNGSSGYCHTATDETILAPNPQPTLSRWVITIDGTSPYKCRIYKDGQQIATRLSLAGNIYNSSSAGADSNGSPFMLPSVVDRPSSFIGRSNFTSDRAFEGYLKYVRIYDSSYTPTQIQNNPPTVATVAPPTIALTTTLSDVTTTVSPTTTAVVRSTQLPQTGTNANNWLIALAGAIVLGTGALTRVAQRSRHN